MALYSVVVPVYNGEHMLEELYQRLAVVFDETIFQPFELIMVDDGSKDRSYEVMQQFRPTLRRSLRFSVCQGRFCHHHGRRPSASPGGNSQADPGNG